MLLAARREAGLQRLGWMPLFGFIGGCVSYVSVQHEEALARVVAAMLLAGWVWLCFQTSIRYKFHKIRSPGDNEVAIDLVMRGVQQGILFFSLPFLVLSTQTKDPGQVLITAFVILSALLSTVDSLYQKFILNRHSSFVAFHCLCSFVASLILLPIAVTIPPEKSFNIALLFVLLWLVVGAPLNHRHKDISLRIFVLALAFPLIVWSVRAHIPPAGILVESSILANGIADQHMGNSLSKVNAEQLKRGLHLHSSITAPLGLSEGIIVNWRHGAYAEEVASTTTGGAVEGYRTYASKKYFMPDAYGHWTVDILTSERQLLDRVEFEVLPGLSHSPVFAAPRTELSMPRVTGLVIKPSM